MKTGVELSFLAAEERVAVYKPAIFFTPLAHSFFPLLRNTAIDKDTCTETKFTLLSSVLFASVILVRYILCTWGISPFAACPYSYKMQMYILFLPTSIRALSLFLPERQANLEQRDEQNPGYALSHSFFQLCVHYCSPLCSLFRSTFRLIFVLFFVLPIFSLPIEGSRKP